jgi:hypothetical protein
MIKIKYLAIIVVAVTLTACVGIPDSDGFFGIPGI